MGSHPVLLIVALVVGGAVALIGLFRPFLGLALFIFIRFLQPAELFPPLAPLHIERVYGILLFGVFLLHQTTRPTGTVLTNRVVVASFALIGVAFVSIPLSVWRGGALRSTADLITLVSFLILIGGLVDTKERLLKTVWIMVGLLAWFSISGMFAYLRGNISMQEGIARAVGITSMVDNPNQLGGLILALLPFLVPLLKFNRNIMIRGLLLACGGLALVVLVLTGARTCLIALVVLFAYYTFRSRHKMVILFAFLILAVTGWMVMPQEYQMRYLTLITYAQGGPLDASNQLRLRVWEVGKRMFFDHPILGVGIGQFPTAYGTLYATRLHQAWMYPHNLLIQVACELGVVGVIFFMYFFVQLLRELRATLRMNHIPGSEFVVETAAACQAMLVGLIVLSGTGHTLLRPYWYLLGGLVVASRFVAKELENQVSKEGNPDEEAETRSSFEFQTLRT